MHVALVKLLYDATMKSRTSLRALTCLFLHIVMHRQTDENDNDQVHMLKIMICLEDDIFDSAEIRYLLHIYWSQTIIKPHIALGSGAVLLMTPGLVTDESSVLFLENLTAKRKRGCRLRT